MSLEQTRGRDHDPCHEGGEAGEQQQILSLSMGKTPTLDPQDPEVLAAIKAICAGTRKCGKIAGVHTDGAKTAIRRFGEGYQLCTILSDARLMANAAAAGVRAARVQMAQAGAKTY